MKRSPPIPLWHLAIAERQSSSRADLYRQLRDMGHGPTAIANAFGISAGGVRKLLMYSPVVARRAPLPTRARRVADALAETREKNCQLRRGLLLTSRPVRVGA